MISHHVYYPHLHHPIDLIVLPGPPCPLLYFAFHSLDPPYSSLNHRRLTLARLASARGLIKRVLFRWRLRFWQREWGVLRGLLEEAVVGGTGDTLGVGRAEDDHAVAAASLK